MTNRLLSSIVRWLKIQKSAWAFVKHGDDRRLPDRSPYGHWLPSFHVSSPSLAFPSFHFRPPHSSLFLVYPPPPFRCLSFSVFLLSPFSTLLRLTFAAFSSFMWDSFSCLSLASFSFSTCSPKYHTLTRRYPRTIQFNFPFAVSARSKLPHPASNSLTPPVLEIQLPNRAHSTFQSPLALVIQLPIQPFNRSVASHSRCDRSIDRVQLPIRPFNRFSLSAPAPQERR
jgi:hypothetical protein